MKKPDAGGGWQALKYTLAKARDVGPVRLARALASRNACKTCALGMGGQMGGMRNEAGHFPEVCKKSLQAMAADMRGRIEPRFFETYSVDELRQLSPYDLESQGRIVDPLVLGPGDTHFRVTDWDEALSHLSEHLTATSPERAFFYASGRSSNEAGFVLQLLARVFGTNHVNNCSYYCHQASGVGLHSAIGAGTATVELEDLEQCDTVFLIGGNPASNHPRLMATLARLRDRGGQVVVVNPMKEVGLVKFRVPSRLDSMVFGSEIASHYLMPRIGGDIAVMTGIAKWLVEHGKTDAQFLAERTEGAEELVRLVAQTPWKEIEAESGLTQAEVETVARVYAESERCVFAWTMGITHHTHGVENVQWIANLALLRGMVGHPGAGLLPIRGHSNVQGMGTIGVTPAMTRAALEGLESLGVKVPEFSGLDTLSTLERTAEGGFDFGLCLGGNLFGASPDSKWTHAAMSKLKCVAYLSTTLNTGHMWGQGETTVVLPVRARDEESQSTTQESMFSYVRLSDGGPTRFVGPRGEVDVLCDLANRAFDGKGPLDWEGLRDHDAVRSLIARLVPGLSQIETIGQTRREFRIPGRRVTRDTIKTGTGRARFHAVPMPTTPALGDDELRLMTIRSEGQFNTVVYEIEDTYRGQERRDVILMNKGDIHRMGLTIDQKVEVASSVGSMRDILVREAEIAAGCAAMYCPECNVIVPRTADPRSRTPAFKSVVVTVQPARS